MMHAHPDIPGLGKLKEDIEKTSGVQFFNRRYEQTTQNHIEFNSNQEIYSAPETSDFPLLIIDDFVTVPLFLVGTTQFAEKSTKE